MSATAESASMSISKSLILETFGGLRIRTVGEWAAEDSARIEALNSRRRVLAVLTVLAISPVPISRDALIDFFWSDSDPVKGRHSLAESLSALRAILGPNAVAARSQQLQLDPTSGLRVDAALFRDAADRRDWAAAVGLYRGPFLDGVFLERAARFDDWASRERDRLRDLFVAACSAECERLQTRGVFAEATDLSRRWLDAEPLSDAAAFAWLSALAAPGTRASRRVALEKYETYRAHLAADYELAPEPQVILLARRIAEEHETDLAEVESADAVMAVTERVALDVDSSPAAVAGATTESPPPRAGRRMAWLAAPMAIVALIAWITLRDQRSVTNAPMWVVIADAENGARDSTLGPAVRLAMATALGDAQNVRVLPDDRARRLRRLAFGANDSARLDEARALIIAQRSGAGAVVVPTIVSLGARFRLTARLIASPSSRVMAVLESAPVDSTQLLAALDDVIRRARRTFGEAARAPTVERPLPELTTTSLVALRQYARGRDLFDHRRYAEALTAHQAAVAADTTFALAYAQLGALWTFINQPDSAEWAFQAASRHRARLTARERLVLESTIARSHRQYDRSIALREGWLQEHPDDDDIANGLALDLFQSKQVVRAIALYERLLARDSTDINAWLNLAEASVEVATPASRERAIAAWTRVFLLDSAQLSDPIISQRFTGTLIELGRTDSAAQVFRRSLSGDSVLRARTLRTLGQLALWQGRPRDAVAPLNESVTIMLGLQQALGAVRAQLFLVEAYRLLADTAAERREYARMATVAQGLVEPTALYWAGKALARYGDVRAARIMLRQLSARVVPANASHVASRDLLAGEIAIAEGNATRGLALIQGSLAKDSSVITYESMAYATERTGDMAQARRRYEELANTKPRFGWEGALVNRLAPIHAASLAQRTGDTVAAQRWMALARAQTPTATEGWPPRVIR